MSFRYEVRYYLYNELVVLFHLDTFSAALISRRAPNKLPICREIIARASRAGA